MVCMTIAFFVSKYLNYTSAKNQKLTELTHCLKQYEFTRFVSKGESELKNLKLFHTRKFLTTESKH